MTPDLPAMHTIEELHRAYCESAAIELPLNQTFIRWWWDAHGLGLTPDGVRLCVKARIAFNRTSQFKKSLELKKLIRDEEDVAVALNEVAVVRANQRIKVYSPAKAQVLRDTGRPDEPPSEDGKHIAEYIQKMRKAAE